MVFVVWLVVFQNLGVLDFRILSTSDFSQKWLLGMEKSFKVEEVLKMEDLKYLRKINELDVIRMARERGYVVNNVVMDEARFIKFCKVLGFKPEEVIKVIPVSLSL